MIAAIERKDIPPQGNRERSAVRQFAFEAVGEFLEKSSPGDVYEVTGWPDIPAESAIQRSAKVVGAIRTELWHFDKRSEAEVYRRRERVFLERKEPKVFAQPRPVPEKVAPRRWPEDFQKVS